MKPLNLDNKPCSPISSNCVIWQGPDIPCINLCTGDTVSDVVYKIATELCTVLDTLKVDNYDLTCFNINSCGPKDFQALIQFLIDQICASENVSLSSTPASSGCPDCVVSVAPCFVVGTQTTMQLIDYVQAIANKICALITEIANINNTIDQIEVALVDIQNQIDNLPTYTLPSILVDCNLSATITAGGTYQIDAVLTALINDDTNGYCALINATGLPADIISAVTSQCIADGDATVSNPAVTYGSLAGWISSLSVDTVAGAINNLWLVVCDLYNGLSSYVAPTSVVTAGDWITVTSSTVGTVTTYEVSETEKPGLSVFLSPVGNILKTAPGLNTGRLCDGTIQVMPSIEYNDFGVAYDATTGIFTVPTDGVYQISFFVHLTRDAGTGWYDAGVPGMITAGIMSPTGCQFYCVNNNSPVVIQKHSSINGSFTRKLTTGTQICLKVINLTNYDYLSETGDVARFSVQRVK
jgi:hypothetical protein